MTSLLGITRYSGVNEKDKKMEVGVHYQKLDDGHIKPLSQEHIPFELCNPINENIEMV
jgi:hypothetical protein